MSESAPEQVVLVKQMHRWKMAFFGLATLLAGMVIGACLTLIVLRHFHRNADRGIELINQRVMEHLQQKLELSPEQAEQVKALFDKHMGALHEIREQAKPKIAHELNLLYEEVMAVLDAEQQEKWRDHVERLRDRFGPPSEPGQERRGRWCDKGRGRNPDSPPGPFHFWEKPHDAPSPPPPGDAPAALPRGDEPALPPPGDEQPSPSPDQPQGQ